MKGLVTRRRLALTGLLILALLSLAPPALAIGWREGQTVVIGADEVIEDDLYVGAGTFILEGIVEGDLFVGGETIIINGTVEGDLWAAGNSVEVNGVVTDDARMGGAALTLGRDAEVGDDLMVAGYSFESKAGSTVGGTFFFGGAQALLSGIINEDVYVGSNGLEIEGVIEGSVWAEVGDPTRLSYVDPSQYWDDLPPVPRVATGLTLGREAKIGGDLEYRSSIAVDVSVDVVDGAVDHIRRVSEGIPELVTGPGLATWWALVSVRRLVAFVIVGLLLVWLARSWIKRPAEKLRSQPWLCLGWGAMTYFLFPLALCVLVGVVIVVAVVLGAATLGEMVLAVLVVGFTFVLALAVVYGLIVVYLSKIVFAYWIGDVILASSGVKGPQRMIWSLLTGLLIVSAVMAIPCLGSLFALVVSMLGLGSLWLLRSQR
jgi:hypothetical protein